MRTHLVFLTALFSLPLGCTRDTATGRVLDRAEDAAPIRREPTEFRLAFAEKHTISYRVESRDFNNPEALPTSRQGLEITFPSLSHEQYLLLMNRYGGQNLVPYREGKSYSLVDFLPPKLQALVNRKINTKYWMEPRIPREWRQPTLPDEEIAVGVDTNCWSITYEAIRDFGRPLAELTGNISYIGNQDFEAVAWDDSSKQILKETLSPENWKGTAAGARVNNRKLGDVLQVRSSQWPYKGVLHTAIFIDEDLYFEKTNAGPVEPVRLATFKTVVEPYIGEPEEMPPGFELAYVRYQENSFPPQTHFAGKYPYIRELPLPPLPADIASTHVFALELGGGGAFEILAVRKIMSYSLSQDADTGRAIFVDAEEFLGSSAW